MPLARCVLFETVGDVQRQAAMIEENESAGEPFVRLEPSRASMHTPKTNRLIILRPQILGNANRRQ